MNFSFRGGAYGFSRGFNTFKNFNKSFFNNKAQFKFERANKGSLFQINYGNKHYMTKMQLLNQSHPLVGKMGPTVGNFEQLGSSDEGVKTSLASLGAEANTALILLGDLCFINEDCKWTCVTRLVSGPQSPVL